MTNITARSENEAAQWLIVYPCPGVVTEMSSTWRYCDHHKMELLEVPSLNVVHEIELEYACCVDFTPDGTALLLGSWQSGYLIPLSELWSIRRLQ